MHSTTDVPLNTPCLGEASPQSGQESLFDLGYFLSLPFRPDCCDAWGISVFSLPVETVRPAFKEETNVLLQSPSIWA